MDDTPSAQSKDPFASTITRRRLLINGGIVVGGAMLAGPLAACGQAAQNAGGGSPKRGGNFRLGVTGGGAKDMIDGQSIITKPDQARLVAGFETLLEYDVNYKLQTTGLAESVNQDAPDKWTIRLKQGITFHNGKPLTADDVVYSFQRILTTKGLFGKAGLASVDPNNITKMDERTVRLNLKSPDSTIGDQLGQYYNGMVPVGYTRTGEQIGTGPYKVKSFTPGQQSVHERNPNYWRSGQPYFDTVTIIDFPDVAAQVNALLGGQIDAMTDIPAAQINVVKGHGGLAILEGQGADWRPLCMAIDMPPFDDNNVRQALRLVVDRNAMLQQVFSGHGRIANDLYSPFDPAYDSSLPQRHRDIAKAKSLLKKAGKENLTIDLHTTDGAAGMVDSANIFATQAKEAGITVNVKNDPNYYGDAYLKLAFSVDFWGTRNYLPQVSNGSLPTSPYNECHWPPKDSNYIDLYQQALREVDAGKRKDLIHQMQKLEYEQGGYIIPMFNNLVDAYSTKVAGFNNGSKATLNLDSMGHGFRTIWFA
ncbi:MAG TPA: ABC transporter substrate-binding protein [Candidatus Angelobacter sp.]|jgi:peptide/nickel transport system substrate-binding protein|nr:ABC transporter substrate-binding protein [Candidatus Angelobacter sp.]